MDDRLLGHIGVAAYNHFRRGGRTHGSDLSPAVRHIGHKMAKVGQYAQIAAAGYKLGKKFVNSFSQKEKTNMAPTKRRLSAPAAYPSPRPMKKVKLSQGLVRKFGRPTVYRQIGVKSKLRPQRVFGGRLGGRVKSPNKRVPKAKMFEMKGVSRNLEYASTQDSTTQQTVIIGHSTVVSEQILRIAIGAVLKKLFQKMQLEVTSWNDVLSTNDFTVGDVFQFSARRAPNAALTTFSYTLVLADVDTALGFNNLVTKIISNLRNYVNSTFDGLNLANEGLRFGSVKYVPLGTLKHPLTELSLIGCKISMLAKSDLKIQNQSVTVSTDNQADNVNNVPIYGKSYQGSGTGFQVTLPRTTAIAGMLDTRMYNVERNRGIIIENGTSSNLLLEPWQRGQFRGAKQDGKLGINPGEIKTSSLSQTMTITLDRIVRDCCQQVTNTAAAEANPSIKFGKFRMMILDKVIGGTGFTGVKISYEHNYYIAGYFQPGYSTATVPYYEFVA